MFLRNNLEFYNHFHKSSAPFPSSLFKLISVFMLLAVPEGGCLRFRVSSWARGQSSRHPGPFLPFTVFRVTN